MRPGFFLSRRLSGGRSRGKTARDHRVRGQWVKEEESVQLCVPDVHLTFPSLNSSGRKEFRVMWLRYAWA